MEGNCGSRPAICFMLMSRAHQTASLQVCVLHLQALTSALPKEVEYGRGYQQRTPSQLRASIALAVNVRARQVALNATKDQLRRQGLRVSQFTQRDLRVRAEAYLEAHRAQLIEDAKADVERWRASGFFGKRARDTVQVHKMIEV